MAFLDWLLAAMDDQPRITAAKADLLVGYGEYERAVRVVEDLMRRYPDDVGVLQKLVEAHRGDPSSATVKDTLGNLPVHAGELECGLELLKDANRAAASDATIGFHYGAGLAGADRAAEARSCC